jgi:hypothetical protein
VAAATAKISASSSVHFPMAGTVRAATGPRSAD